MISSSLCLNIERKDQWVYFSLDNSEKIKLDKTECTLEMARASSVPIMNLSLPYATFLLTCGQVWQLKTLGPHLCFVLPSGQESYLRQVSGHLIQGFKCPALLPPSGTTWKFYPTLTAQLTIFHSPTWHFWGNDQTHSPYFRWPTWAWNLLKYHRYREFNGLQISAVLEAKWGHKQMDFCTNININLWKIAHCLTYECFILSLI